MVLHKDLHIPRKWFLELQVVQEQQEQDLIETQMHQVLVRKGQLKL